MKNNTRRVLFWFPRILCILYAMFLSMFALDVFSEGYGFTQTILALIMHLVPTYLVVIALVIACRWEGVGAILFNAFGSPFPTDSIWKYLSNALFVECIVARLISSGVLYFRRASIELCLVPPIHVNAFDAKFLASFGPPFKEIFFPKRLTIFDALVAFHVTEKRQYGKVAAAGNLPGLEHCKI